MANQLKMAKVQTILTLRSRGWSLRRIARELGVDWWKRKLTGTWKRKLTRATTPNRKGRSDGGSAVRGRQGRTDFVEVSRQSGESAPVLYIPSRRTERQRPDCFR